MAGWVKEIEHLPSIAISQPHAAYAAFTHGLIHNKWTYFSRTIPNLEELFEPLEDTIQQQFLPSLTGQNAFNDNERDLMALPSCHGGQASTHNEASKKITEPLFKLIHQQSHTYPLEVRTSQIRAKNNAHNHRRQLEAVAAADVKAKLPKHLQRAVSASSENGASSWLSTLPIEKHVFAFHKGAFRDALCLRYCWHPLHLPTHCITIYS